MLNALSLVLGIAGVALENGVPPGEMRDRVAQRLSRLDRLIVEFNCAMHAAASDSDPFDPASWGDRTENYPHRMTIVRPNVLDQSLRDEPERGYEPVTDAVFDAQFVRQYLTPRFGAARAYLVSPFDVQVGNYRGTPTLQFAEVHLQDSTISQLNLLRLFDEYDVELLGCDGDVSTYRAIVPMDSWTSIYEFSLNPRGTPLRCLTTLLLPEPLKPGTWEMRTCATTEVNGAEFVSDAVIVVSNPNLGVASVGVSHFSVNSVEHCDWLDESHVRIVPDYRDARVTVIEPDGSLDHRRYDSNGLLVDSIVTAGASPSDIGIVSRDSLRWRWIIPPLAVATGVATLLGLRALSQRRHHPHLP